MIHDRDRFERVISYFEKVNSKDPRTECFDGIEYPKEVLYAKRMTIWLNKLYPNASEALQLAVRCHHIRRWAIPRKKYVDGRDGYLKWRNQLKKFHARIAANLLKRAGYDPVTIRRVRFLIKKERLKGDLETQALEDVACIVFLESHFAGFSKKMEVEKLTSIISRTWKKMSPKGRQAALKLELPPDLRSIIFERISDV